MVEHSISKSTEPSPPGDGPPCTSIISGPVVQVNQFHFLILDSGILVHSSCFWGLLPRTSSSHMDGERGNVLGLLALRRHNVVAPAAAVDTDVPPQGGIAYHRPGVVLPK